MALGGSADAVMDAAGVWTVAAVKAKTAETGLPFSASTGLGSIRAARATSPHPTRILPVFESGAQGGCCCLPCQPRGIFDQNHACSVITCSLYKAEARARES